MKPTLSMRLREATRTEKRSHKAIEYEVLGLPPAALAALQEALAED